MVSLHFYEGEKQTTARWQQPEPVILPNNQFQPAEAPTPASLATSLVLRRPGLRSPSGRSPVPFAPVKSPDTVRNQHVGYG